MEKNKKTLILSILAVLVLIIAVVGVSYAMYTFAATGTKENYIQTGSISLNYQNEATCTVSNAYPKTMEVGLANPDCTMSFDVVASLAGTTTINYELGLTYDGAVTLPTNAIRFTLQKGETYILGSAAAGVLMSDYTAAGAIAGLTNRIQADSFTASGTHSYVLKAWVDGDFDFETIYTNPDENTTTGTSGLNGTAGNLSRVFKISLKAAQTV